jgi:DNA-binding IclR family transcriptional regulator
MALSPTLWRTCRVLSGPTRLTLFRCIVQNPGCSVTELADEARIGLSRASQELRRLQSRGLVGVERTGRFVRYYPESDPLVSSAKPILRAMLESFARSAAGDDRELARLAQGLGHARRIEIVRALRAGSLDLRGLQARLPMPMATLHHHVKLLAEAGWILRDGQTWKLAASGSPLAQSLLKLL